MKTKILLRIGFVLLWFIATISCRTHEDPVTPHGLPVQGKSTAIQAFADTSRQKSAIAEKSHPVNAGADVYVCKSAGAKKYHYNEDCGGLHRCKHTIEKWNVKEAQAVGLTACSYKKCNQ